ncbi:MAG: patatin-like phospholipase family protein [Verrucomicrobiota bacterium]
MLGNIRRFFRSVPRPPRRAGPIGGASALKLGLALSSGGASGLAHIGVLQVLEENKIEIHAIAGASMGAYVGALWAAGFSGKALEALAAEINDRRQLWKLADLNFPPMKGLFQGRKARAHLERSLGDLRFEDLERCLLVVTVDLDTKERLVLRHGKIAEAVHASCAMPGIVAPVMIDGRRCVDGGVIDPLPVGALQKFAAVDRVLAVSVIPTFADVEEGLCRRDVGPPIAWWRHVGATLNGNLNLFARGNVVDTFRQSIRAAQIRLAHGSCKRADYCLHPEYIPAPWHDYPGFRRFIDAGRQVAIDHLDEIRTMLQPERHDHEIPLFQRLVGHDVA